LEGTEVAARSLGLTLEVLAAGDSAEVGKAFDRAIERKAQAAFQIFSPRFSAMRVALSVLAIEKRLPAACEHRDFALAGCLVSYGPSFDAMYRRSAFMSTESSKAPSPQIFQSSGRRSSSSSST
jgi:hypothetical protein